MPLTHGRLEFVAVQIEVVMEVNHQVSEIPKVSRDFVAVACASSSSQQPNPLGSELSSELARCLESFLAANPVDVVAASALRSASPHVQLVVLQKGSLRWARNPSASLMWQLRKLACVDRAPMNDLVHCSNTAAAAGPCGVDPSVIPAVPITPKPVDASHAASKSPTVGFVSVEKRQAPQPAAAVTSAVPASLDRGGNFQQGSKETQSPFSLSANQIVPCTSATVQGCLGSTLYGFESPSACTSRCLSPSTMPCSTLPTMEAGFLTVSSTEDAGELWFCVEEFLLANPVDARAAAALRTSPPHVKKAILAGGSLRGASNSSAVLMNRLKSYSHNGDARFYVSNVCATNKPMHHGKLIPHDQLNYGLCPPVSSRRGRISGGKHICDNLRKRVRPHKFKSHGQNGEAAKTVTGRAGRRVVVCRMKEERRQEKEDREQAKKEKKLEKRQRRKKIGEVEDDLPGCAPRYTAEQAKRLGQRRYGYTVRQAAQFRSLIRADKELWEAVLVFDPVDLVCVHARFHGSHEPLVGRVDLRAVGDFLKDEGIVFVDSRSRTAWSRWRKRHWHKPDKKRPRQDTKSQHEEDGESEEEAIAESVSDVDDGDTNLLPVLPTISDSDECARLGGG
mmetsp:Transcript_118938/g.237053  ORF Transcript_118938/g.237053 Transcript_118938/m.237053 type:complete len:621 (+) Transcript_118938:118-1980(+)